MCERVCVCNTRTRNEKKKQRKNFIVCEKNAHDEDRCRVRVLNENLKKIIILLKIFNKTTNSFLDLFVCELLRELKKQKKTDEKCLGRETN